MPYVTPSLGDGRGAYADAAVLRSAWAVSPPWMGDGHGQIREPAPALMLGGGDSLAPQMSHTVVNDVVFGSDLSRSNTTGTGPMATPKGEIWKLLMLVVFFVLWISTASTLLFLYMDRYLFPG